jgi:hypothetical protein
MAGRRSHPRFAVSTPWDGSMRVLKDVVIHRTDTDELLAVSRTAGITGEEMTLDVMGAGASLGLRVRVLESRPVIVDGAVCHRVRLALLMEEPAATSDTEAAAEREAISETRTAPLTLSGPLAEAI